MSYSVVTASHGEIARLPVGAKNILEVQQRTTDFTQRSALWCRAWDKYAASLRPAERDAIFSVTSKENLKSLSIGDITELLTPLRAKYDKTVFGKCLQILGPTISRLKSFTSIVDVFVQSNPDVSALVWGSIKTLLVVVVNFHSSINAVAEGLDQICFELPLFDRWSRQFPETEFGDLHETLTGAYCEVIGFCVEIITLFTKSPAACYLGLLLPDILKSRIAAMREQTRRLKLQLDTEAYESLNNGIKKLLNGDSIRSKPLSSTSIYYVPAYKVPRYFPRPELEKNLLSFVSPKAINADFSSVCVYGPRGSGKSQLVLDMLRKVRDEFSTVLWFQASSVEKLDKDFGKVGERLGIPITSSQSGNVIDIVLNWLRCADDPWILVFDDVNDVSVMHEVWPNNAATGLVIVITNDPVSMNVLTSSNIHVPPYTLDEGASFLSFYLDNISQPQARVSNQYHHHMAISKVLGAFPLSMSHAANFMSTADCPPSEFLEILDVSPIQDLNEPLAGYCLSVEDIWRLSFSGLEADAERLLDILTFFDSDAIPLAVLRGPLLAEYHEFMFLSNVKRFRCAYRSLRSRSLIQENGEFICFHRFFQGALINGIREDKNRYQRAFEASLSLLSSKFPKHTFSKRRDTASWATCEMYIEHCGFLEQRAIGYEWSDSIARRLAQLLYQAAWYFFERGRLKRGLVTIESSRSFLDEENSDNFVLLADTCWMQGRFYNQSNQPHRSVTVFSDAIKYAELAVRMGLLDASSPRLASMYSSLGNAFTGLKRFTEAKECHMKSIAVREASPSTQGEMIAMSYTNMGSCLLWEGNLEEAEETLHKVLHKFDRRLECSQYALGNTWLAQGRLQEALSIHREVLSRFLERSGYDHTDTANSCHKIGVLHHKLGEPDQALVFLSKALDMYDTQGRHSDMRPARARTLWYLSMVLEESGDLVRAKEVKTEAETLLSQVDVYKDPEQSDIVKVYDELVFFWYR